MTDQPHLPYGEQPPQPAPTQPIPPYGAAAPPPAGPSGAGTTDAKGFLGALFDLSFTHFVTPMIVKFVYILSIALLVFSWFLFLVTAFSQSAGLGVVVLLLGPIALIVYLAVIRMTLEFYLAIVRMSEDVHKRLPRS